MFSRAIVRPPAPNFSEGLTTAGLGQPSYELALRQHQAYCQALEQCGVALMRLDPVADYPDSCFVEDVAVLIDTPSAYPFAILIRPGAAIRRGEVDSMRAMLAGVCASLSEIRSPGSVDGGDVCQAGNHFFIGISERTNPAGAEQLAGLLAPHGFTSSFVDLTKQNSLLHLKSGLACLGDNRLVVTRALADQQVFARYELICIDAGEEYAANCVRVNNYVLVAAGCPAFESRLRALACRTIALDMSEFQKMDGGLSCLSLRF